MLGITAVDPEKHDLLFERFVSASRGEPPDIDIDFEHERREEVIQHVYDRYGRDRAALVGLPGGDPEDGATRAGQQHGAEGGATAGCRGQDLVHRGARQPAAGQRQSVADRDASTLVLRPANTLQPRHAGPQGSEDGSLVERGVGSS